MDGTCINERECVCVLKYDVEGVPRYLVYVRYKWSETEWKECERERNEKREREAMCRQQIA